MGRDCRIRTSYQVVTPESAEIGDFADSGWENENGHCINPDESDIEEYGNESDAIVDFTLDYLRRGGGGLEASDYPTCHPGHTWYTETEGEQDYADGSVKTLSFHLDGFTEEEECVIYTRITGR